MRRLTLTMAILGIMSAAALLVWLGHRTLRGGDSIWRANTFYYPADLMSMRLPIWNEPDEVPLAPHRAVAAAKIGLKKYRPDVAGWSARRIELECMDGSNWVYRIELQGFGPDSFASSSLRVLMDGRIWEPSARRH